MAPKSTEDIEREEFLRQMLEMNARIRQFQQKASAELAERCSGPPSADGKQGKSAEDSVDQMNKINAEVHVLEEEYQKDLLELEKLRHELADVRAKRTLMEAVMKETKQLQELRGRVAELESVHNSLAEELQKRYMLPQKKKRDMCPGYGTNNMAAEEEEAAPAPAPAPAAAVAN